MATAGSDGDVKNDERVKKTPHGRGLVLLSVDLDRNVPDLVTGSRMVCKKQSKSGREQSTEKGTAQAEHGARSRLFGVAKPWGGGLSQGPIGHSRRVQCKVAMEEGGN